MSNIITPQNKSVLAEYVTKTFEIEGERITIKKLSGNDQLELDKITDNLERGIEVILRSAVNWTFKNIDGQALPLNKENLLRIRADILSAIGVECFKYNKAVEVKD